MHLKGGRVTVIGLGKTGISSAVFLKDHGYSVKVSESARGADFKDSLSLLKKYGIRYETGGHTQDFIKESDFVVTSPGVRLDSKAILWAREENIKIISEIELAYKFCPAPIIAVTGTNGKSTVTTLIGKILTDANRSAVVCGNIGVPFIEKIPSIKKEDIVALEVSSFQLMFIKDFKAHIAILLNISQNHLDWHKDMANYINAKSSIFKNQTKDDFAVLNFNCTSLATIRDSINSKLYYFSLEKKVEGAYIEGKKFYVSLNGVSREINISSQIPLKGKHNLENILAALIAVKLYKIKNGVIKKSIANFKGLEHRFEPVALIEGVKYINDSKSTTVDATLKAVNTCDGKVILIAGGRDKGSDFTLLRNLSENKLKHLVLIGEAKEKIAASLDGLAPAISCKSIKEAVLVAKSMATKGDYVLLSPMCTSFDMFKNFEERGDIFKKAVLSIKNSL
jgi:UDP-N-acetylmuramoylalanine--D-glutamate ligase